MLAYSSIAHSGYMLVALLVGPGASYRPLSDGLAALLFYIAAYGVMNLGAFAVLAYVRRPDGSEIEELDDLSGLWRREPAAATAMIICSFSLLGMPPTVGFFGKVFIFLSAFSLPAGHPHVMAMIVLAIIGVLASAIGAAYYLRIVAACLIGEPVRRTEPVLNPALQIGVAICSIVVLLAGVFPGWLHSRSAVATQSVRSGSVPADQLVLSTESPAEDGTS
jgi:NADH-quinone oxidoreductase subunit N